MTDVIALIGAMADRKSPLKEPIACACGLRVCRSWGEFFQHRLTDCPLRKGAA